MPNPALILAYAAGVKAAQSGQPLCRKAYTSFGAWRSARVAYETGYAHTYRSGAVNRTVAL